jgi:hypothetical protein
MQPQALQPQELAVTPVTVVMEPVRGVLAEALMLWQVTVAWVPDPVPVVL